jgi:zinc/manganese transport system ATP-binding protein
MVSITLENLTIGYDRHPAVHHVNAHFPQGSLTAITGPNGAGKTTVLRGIMNWLPPSSGRVICDGITPDQIAYLPQNAQIDRDFPISVGEIVASGFLRKLGVFGGYSNKMKHQIMEALEKVGLSGFVDRPISTLSGGQMQRALFARLLLQEAKAVLLDEPFSAVDARTAADLMQLLQTWAADGRIVIAILHDLEAIRKVFPHTLLLARERIAFGPTQDVLTPAHLDAARKMCEAFDPHAPICQDHAA